MPHPNQTEIESNFEYFKNIVTDYVESHEGEFVLLHNQKVISFYENAYLAAIEGYKRFSDGSFSVQEVTTKPLDLGFYSHVASQTKSA